MDVRPRLQLTSFPIYTAGEDAPVTQVRSRKVWELVGYLHHTRKTVERKAVALLLWPESQPETAQQNLRKTLQYVRDLLVGSNEWLVSNRTTLAIDHAKIEIECDSEFRAKFGGLWGEDQAPATEERDDDPINVPFRRLDPETRRTALLGMAPAMMNMGQFLEGIHEIQTLRRRSEFSQDFNLAMVEVELRAAARQVVEAEQILTQFRNHSQTAQPKNLTRMRSLEGLCSFYGGRFARSRELSFESLKVGTTTGTMRYASRALNVAMGASYFLGELSTVDLILKRALRHTANEATGSWRHFFEFMQVYIDVERRPRNEFRPKLEHLSQRLMADSQPGLNGIFLARVGHLFLRTGDPILAEKHYDESLRRLETTDCFHETAEVHSYLGDLYANRNDHRRAYRSHLAGARLRKPLSAPLGLGTSLRGAGVAASQMGMYAEALTHLNEAAKVFSGINNDFGIASTRIAIARNSLRMGQTSRARAEFQEALATIEKAYEKTPQFLRPAEFQSMEVLLSEFNSMQTTD